MGIRLLTKFVDRRFMGWKKRPVKGKLIIEGSQLAYSLFEEFVNSTGLQTEMYGGDYVSIARQMDEFFHKLLEAGINPLVVLDGIDRDEKRADVITQRKTEKLENVASLFYPDRALPTERVTDEADESDGQRRKKQPTGRRYTKPFFILNAMIDSVKRVLGDGNLFVADSDADVDIACLAIHHQCPVLSNESDFYAFPLLHGYIPYSRFKWRNADRNAIYGEFYFYQLFCEQFRIRDPSLLTIIPAIVGNNTIFQLNENVLKLIIPEFKKLNAFELVANAVKYVSTFNTFDACLTSLRKLKLFGMIKSIQVSYHDYFFLPLFKPRNSLTTSLHCMDGSPLPDFILKMHRKGLLFTFVVNALRSHKVRFSVVVEDVLSESWCRLIGIPIRKVIYGILCGDDVCILEDQRCEQTASYEDVEIKSTIHVTYDGNVIPLPTLQSCVSEDADYRKKILFGILDVREDDFESIPQDFQLLLAITQYWYKHCTIDKKVYLLKSFLILLQLFKENKMKIGHELIGSPGPFRIASFAHAFAQWQTLYHDIQCLDELLQTPLKLIPVSYFLEFSYLYSLVEAVMKEEDSKILDRYYLNRDTYQMFFAVTSPSS